jgi:hypothetical protein
MVELQQVWRDLLVDVQPPLVVETGEGFAVVLHGVLQMK